MVEAQKFSIIIGLDKMVRGVSNPFFWGGDMEIENLNRYKVYIRADRRTIGSKSVEILFLSFFLGLFSKGTSMAEVEAMTKKGMI